jgi:DNA polymerase-3 subunit chi
VERVGFYLTGAQPVERVLPLIARAAKKQGQRMLVVAEDEDLLGRLDKALWEQCPEDFLAHGRADAPHAERQPVLLSNECSAANGAALVALADGQWREGAAPLRRADGCDAGVLRTRRRQVGQAGLSPALPLRR